MINEEDLAWLVGFYEGEGSTALIVQRGRTNRHITISVPQAQRWPLDKVLSIVGYGHINGPYHKEGKKSIHSYAITQIQQIREFVDLIYPHLSKRRQDQCTYALTEYDKDRANKLTIEDRILFRVINLDNGCREWTGYKNSHNALIYSPKRDVSISVRNWIYEESHRVRLRKTTHLRAICGNDRCVLVDHLVIVKGGVLCEAESN